MGSGANTSGGSATYVVLYDYDPAEGPNEDDDELSLKEGDLLEGLGEIDEDGFLLARHLAGTFKGKQGMVPSTFIQLETDAAGGSAADGADDEEGAAAFLVRVLYVNFVLADGNSFCSCGDMIRRATFLMGLLLLFSC